MVVLFKISGGLSKQGRIIVELTHALIAALAKHAARATRLVVVVKVPAGEHATAHGAPAALPRKQSVELRKGDAVCGLIPMLSLTPWIGCTPAFHRARIAAPLGVS